MASPQESDEEDGIKAKRIRKASMPKSEEEDRIRENRYRRIIGNIESLTRSNITETYEAILEILAEGEVSWHANGFSWKLAREVKHLCEEPTFAKLVKVLLPLEPYLSTRLMEEIASMMDYTGERKRKCLLDLTTILIQEGANPFHLFQENSNTFHVFKETSVFHRCLEYADNHSSLLPSLSAFLEAAFSKWGVSNTDFLNDVIKGVPSQILEDDSSHAIKELIVKECLKIIETNPAVCDNVDHGRKTPLHNLMEKLLLDGLWKRMPKLVAGTDIIWDLLSQMITEKNVNYKDKDQVTPYTWILLWQDLISDFQPTDASDQQNLEKNENTKKPEWKSLKEKVKEIDAQLFQKKGARKRDALQKLKSVQERYLEGLARKLLLYHNTLRHRLMHSERPCTEIMAELEREVHEDIETVRNLKRKGCGECLGCLSGINSFCLSLSETLNKQILQISYDILQILKSESNAQAVYNYLINLLKYNRVQHSFLPFKYGLGNCVDKHAIPTIDDFYYLLKKEELPKNETLLPAVRLMDLLIQAYRNNGNSIPIEIYLNPMQDLYQVSEGLRLVAHRVIKAAYGTQSNCLESRSVINTLLFLGCGGYDYDNTTIKECLEAVHGCQQRDKTDSSYLFLSRDDLTRKLFKGNDGCLKRNVLHLLAIFVHNKEVLKQIPKEFIEKWKDERDLHGCTPLHIAHLHGNQSFISFLASHEAKVVTDYFGRTPESFAVPYEYCEGDYTEHCQNITTAKSSVFDTMKEMLVLPINECEAIEDNFKVLFERIIAHDGFQDDYIQIAGSVREKLKVGRFNEVDIQICMRKPDVVDYLDREKFLKFHQQLVKNMGKIEWEDIFLRPVSFSWHSAWKFIWEKKGRYNGLVISVDVVLMIANHEKLVTRERQQLLINNAPGHKHLQRLHLDVDLRSTLSPTVCMQEWDILDNLTPGCRLGILIAKALLEVQDQVNENDDGILKAPITSYVIKNVGFWILSGETPMHIQENHGNVIRERYGHLRQQLDFKGTRPTWTTEEDLEKYGEEGRLWAETIFDAIGFCARNYQRKFGSFLDGTLDSVFFDNHEVYDVLQTCEKCLERLRPCVFFNEQTIEDETHQASS